MPIDRHYIDDQHLIARYLADQLPDGERAAFEDYCLEHPETFNAIERTARLKTGLAALRRTGELEKLLKPAPLTQRAPFRSVAAAAIVTATALGIGALFGPAQVALIGATAAAVSERGPVLPTNLGQRVLRTRDPAYDVTIDLPPGPEALRLVIYPEPERPGAEFAVTVRRLGKDNRFETAGTVRPLRSDENGTVTAYVSSRRLEPGVYQLVATPIPTGTASAFRVRVRAASAEPR